MSSRRGIRCWAGTRADSIVRRQLLGLADYYRAKHLQLVFTLDATNGLDRAAESAALVAAGRSITEPAVQRLYRDFAVAVDTLLHPLPRARRRDQPGPRRGARVRLCRR